MATPQDVATFLAEHLRRFSAAPWLFVGSGFSRRYLDLDDWEGLLRRFAGQTAKPYEYYRSLANGSLPRVASELAREFHEVWWKVPEFHESREKHKGGCLRVDSPLKIEISKYMTERSASVLPQDALREELDSLSQAVVDGIVTTNWDMLLEEVFSGYEVFAGQDQLIFSTTQGIGEIYKIHGSCTAPNTLVLTDEDYNRFHDRNPYLAAKLLTTFVEHPIIFIGYSLSDHNIRDLLRAIASCLSTETIAKLRDRLIFIQWSPGQFEVNTDATFVLDGFALPVVSLKVGAFKPIFDVLSGTQRRFPAKLLRRLKRHVFDLVRSENQRQKLHVLDIDAEADLSQVQVVFGVGALPEAQEVTSTTGYRPITRRDLLQDVIFEDRGFDAVRVVEEVLPRVLKAARYVPVFRYLRLAGRYDAAGELLKEGLDAWVLRAARADATRFDPPKWNQKKAPQLRALRQKFREYASSHSPHEVVNYAPLLPLSLADTGDILEFARCNSSLVDGDSVDNVQFIKLVCLYDFLRFGPGAKGPWSGESDA